MDISADLVVLGGGTSGLAAVIAAGRRGRRVVLVEKSGRLGGTLHRAGGHMSAGGTRLQREHGIVDSPEAHLADILRISRNSVDVEMVRRHVHLAPAAIDWLADEGFEFAADCPAVIYGHEAYDRPRTYWGVDGGKTLAELLARRVEELAATGVVTVWLNTVASELITTDGAVAGVRTNKGVVTTDHVVLATGGYAASRELFERFDPGNAFLSAAAPTSTGDGHLLAEAVGAQLRGGGHYLPLYGGLRDPDSTTDRIYEPAPDMATFRPKLVPQARLPWEIWISEAGERFVAEDEPSVDIRERALTAQPGQRFLVLFDRTCLELAPNLVQGWDADVVDAFCAEGRFFTKADTLEELCALVDLPVATTVATVQAYNDAVLGGRPDPLGRRFKPRTISDGPFYAMRTEGVILISSAGIATDTDLRVLTEDGSVIPGLYAVGEALGAHRFSGDAYVGGMSVTPALALGKWLGDTL